MRDYNFYVYILTNWNNKVMYVGMTNNLERRMYEHKNKLVDGFTKKYNVNKLVYYEHVTDVRAAIAREKEIKKWRREKKNRSVMTMNPEWKDLSLEWHVISTSASEDVISTSAGEGVISTSTGEDVISTSTGEDVISTSGSEGVISTSASEERHVISTSASEEKS